MILVSVPRVILISERAILLGSRATQLTLRQFSDGVNTQNYLVRLEALISVWQGQLCAAIAVLP
jgi:hypothetical protein